VLIGCLVLLAAGPAAAQAATGTITGTVTALKGGAPLEGIEVTAYGEGGEELGSASTPADGEYTISVTATSVSAEYKVRFTDPSQTYLAQEGSTTLKEGETRTVNAKLRESGTISGRVTSSANGSGLGGVSVSVSNLETDEAFESTTTESNGDYAIANLPPGLYVIEFYPSSRSGYLSQTTNTTLGEGEDKNVSVALKEGGKISGRVTDAATHSGLAKIRVYAYSSSGEFGSGSVLTNANGEYTVTGLSSGSYKVAFYWEFSRDEEKACEHAPRCIPKYITQYFNNQPSAATANSVGASEGSVTSGINAAMVQSAPVNTALPVVSGTAALGSPLLCSNGSWTGESLALSVGWPLVTPFTYQWLRDGAAIPGATSATYIVQAADLGHGLVCEVTATIEAGKASAKSNPLAVAVPIPVIAIKGSVSKLVVSKNTTKVGIACANASCVGSAQVVERIVVKRRKGKKTITKKETIVLAQGAYSLAAGKAATITLKVTAAGKKKLARAKRHRVSAKLVVAVKGGKQLEKAVQLSLVAAKKKK
jgi:hypothetical protein